MVKSNGADGVSNQRINLLTLAVVLFSDVTVVCRVDDSFDPDVPNLYEEVIVQILYVVSLKEFFVRFPYGAVDRRRTETGKCLY
jgi:hypothetical protein